MRLPPLLPRATAWNCCCEIRLRMLRTQRIPVAGLRGAGAMTCFNMSRQVKEHIGDMQVALERFFRERFNRAIEAGELPRGSAADLARFCAVMIQGLALQAKAGSSRKELHRVVDLYLDTWPPRPVGSGKSSRVDSAGVDARA